MTSRILLAGLAAALSTVVACGGPVDGEPQPVPRTTTGTPSSATGSSSAANAPRSLEDIDPCSLLTRDEAEQISGPLREAPARRDLGTARGCNYKPERRALGIDIRTNAGLDDVQASGQVGDVTIGRHRGKQFVGNTGSCVIAMGVAESSRVDVTFTGTADEDPCPSARRVAELVEPRLP